MLRSESGFSINPFYLQILLLQFNFRCSESFDFRVPPLFRFDPYLLFALKTTAKGLLYCCVIISSVAAVSREDWIKQNLGSLNHVILMNICEQLLRLRVWHTF